MVVVSISGFGGKLEVQQIHTSEPTSTAVCEILVLLNDDAVPLLFTRLVFFAAKMHFFVMVSVSPLMMQSWDH